MVLSLSWRTLPDSAGRGGGGTVGRERGVQARCVKERGIASRL
jgi:hypothetical protein